MCKSYYLYFSTALRLFFLLHFLAPFSIEPTIYPYERLDTVSPNLCHVKHERYLLRGATLCLFESLKNRKLSYLPHSYVNCFKYDTAWGSVLRSLDCRDMLDICEPYYVFLLICLLILKSGDIELNPGPVDCEDITLFHMNIRGIKGKIDLLEAENSRPEVLAFTESHLDGNISNDVISLEGYPKIFRKDFTSASGGVCIYLKESVHGERLEQFEQADLEIVWVKVICNNWYCILGVVYRNPALLVEYWDRLATNIGEVVDIFGSERVVLMGDLNEDLLNNNLKHLRNIISMFAFRQLVTDATRITETSETLIDPFICGEAIATSVKCCEVLPASYSDHCSVLVHIQRNFKVESITRSVWLFQFANWNQFREDLGSFQLDSLFNDDVLSVDDISDIISTSILRAAHTSIPKKKVKMTNRDKKWITPNIKHSMKLRDKLFRKASRTKKNEDFANYKTQRNHVVNLIRSAKRTYNESVMDKINVFNASDKDWWKLVSSTMGKGHGKSKHIPCVKNSDGEHIFEDKDKANAFNMFFSSVSIVDDEGMNLPDPPQIEAGDTVFSFEVLEEDVLNHLKKLDPKKAYGPDGISPLFFINSAAILSPILTKLFRRCLSERIFPSEWKKANVIPIFKKGDPHEVGNYRPVSTLTIASKVFEKIIFKNVYNHVRNKISMHQSGFLPRHSTVTQLLELYHRIIQELDSGKEVLCTFFDISKAFDKVSHKGLVYKLKCYGFGGDFLGLLENYLSDRKMRVVLNGAESTWETIRAGVPQGSVLGPLLFLIFINDIFQDILGNMRLFADDTSQFLASFDLTSDYHSAQNDIDQLLVWAIQWCVTYNAPKSDSMLVSRRRNPSNIQLYFDGQPLQMVQNHKHLGLTLENSGLWNIHVDQTITKALNRLGIARNLKYKIQRKHLETIYNSFIRPILEYADVVWDGIPDYLAESVEKVQIEALRLITGLTVSCSNVNLYAESGYSLLKTRRKFHRLIMFYKIIHNEAPPYLVALLPPRVGDNNPYNLRNQENFTLYPSRTESFSRSFFPSTVRDWNQLPSYLKVSPSLGVFKSRLQKHFFPNKIPLWFYHGNTRFSNIHHCRIRNHCSALRSDLFLNFVTDSPICTYCTENVDEDAIHFFFNCTYFQHERSLLIDDLQNFFQPPRAIPFTEQEFLFGNADFSFNENINLFTAVQNYILRTKRFN